MDHQSILICFYGNLDLELLEALPIFGITPPCSQTNHSPLFKRSVGNSTLWSLTLYPSATFRIVATSSTSFIPSTPTTPSNIFFVISNLLLLNLNNSYSTINKSPKWIALRK
ncbi:hypothetical protein EYC84_004935 [Monilinia fructicola]|uniref:Uncharacterized protein n=1 Tax=Monilinia fructicola TaxID=38448 RepID=A0A5M9K6L2_MONFR|nr:hypothetical protein EYC84_004935 [Monilinia fructicola]